MDEGPETLLADYIFPSVLKFPPQQHSGNLAYRTSVTHAAFAV